MPRQNYDESKFLPKQREAAIALVEYEFTPKKQRKTKDQIAEELGITRKTLYNWDTKDTNFIAYKAHLSSDFLDSHVAFAYNKLLESIEKGSTRSLELFMKRLGDLDNRSEVTINDGTGDDKSAEERKADLLKRLGEQADGGDE